jgi:hypothetical protein
MTMTLIINNKNMSIKIKDNNNLNINNSMINMKFRKKDSNKDYNQRKIFLFLKKWTCLEFQKQIKLRNL